MERIILGKTGISVNRLGFGGIPIQRVGQDQAVETVLHAVRRGVDFIDTARSYTTSEERIGKALRQMDRRVIVASKSQNRTADGIRKDIEISLNNLQQDSIDLYQCHYVKDEDDYQTIISSGRTLAGLLRAKEEGLIGHIGLTSHSLDMLSRVLDDDIFETIMVCFSFLEPAAAEKVIPAAIERNIGVIAMKPFSGGALFNPQLAIKYVLSQPDILVIPGVEETTIFDQNWQVYLGDHALAPSEMKEIEDIRRQYDKSFCRRCDYCQPCSEQIPIQLILGMRYAIHRFGDAILQKEWMQAGIANARRCSQCEECMDRCPYDLPIPDLIRDNLRWLDEDYKG